MSALVKRIAGWKHSNMLISSISTAYPSDDVQIVVISGESHGVTVRPPSRPSAFPH